MDAKRVSGVELRNTSLSAGRTTLQRERTRGRDANGSNLNTIEETASDMNYKVLIETPIWSEDILEHTSEENIKQEAESPELQT